MLGIFSVCDSHNHYQDNFCHRNLATSPSRLVIQPSNLLVHVSPGLVSGEQLQQLLLQYYCKWIQWDKQEFKLLVFNWLLPEAFLAIKPAFGVFSTNDPRLCTGSILNCRFNVKKKFIPCVKINKYCWSFLYTTPSSAVAMFVIEQALFSLGHNKNSLWKLIQQVLMFFFCHYYNLRQGSPIFLKIKYSPYYLLMGSRYGPRVVSFN